MRWLVAFVLLVALLAAFAPAFAGTPPVTQAEAVEFHQRGLCQMAAPGSGITGVRGWISTSLPGRSRLIGAHRDTGEDFLDAVPGKPYFIVLAAPGTQVQWCPIDARPPGRETCGPVPPAFLYEPR